MFTDFIDGLGSGLIAHSYRRWSERLNLLLPAVIANRVLKHDGLLLTVSLMTFCDLGVETRSV